MDYKYEVWRKDGTFYKGNVLPPDPSPWDNPVLHLFLSYHYTACNILRAYGVLPQKKR